AAAQKSAEPLGQDGLHRGGPAARLVIRVEAAAPGTFVFRREGLVVSGGERSAVALEQSAFGGGEETLQAGYGRLDGIDDRSALEQGFAVEQVARASHHFRLHFQRRRSQLLPVLQHGASA